MSDSIQRFMSRLDACGLYKEPLETLQMALEARFGGISMEIAEAAAEIIIRTHNAGAFPRFPACEKAIITAQTKPSPHDLTLGRQQGGITAENFKAKAIEFTIRRGWVVIGNSDPSTQDAIDAWREWYLWKGVPVGLMDQQLARGASWTVPSKYPWEFDLECPPSIGTGGKRREEKIMQQLTAEQRAAIVDRALKRTRTEDATRRANEHNHRKSETREQIDRRLEEFKTMPIEGISPEIARRFRQPEEMPF